MFDPLAILRHSLRRGDEKNYIGEAAMDTAGPSGGQIARVMPQTLSEVIEQQIMFHEAEIKKLKDAKQAITPDVERALNALAKL